MTESDSTYRDALNDDGIVDYADHNTLQAQVAQERREEHGMRVTVVVEWERADYSDGFFDGKRAEQLKDVLYRVAEMGAQHETNGTVRVTIEKLGD